MHICSELFVLYNKGLHMGIYQPKDIYQAGSTLDYMMHISRHLNPHKWTSLPLQASLISPEWRPNFILLWRQM